MTQQCPYAIVSTGPKQIGEHMTNRTEANLVDMLALPTGEGYEFTAVDTDIGSSTYGMDTVTEWHESHYDTSGFSDLWASAEYRYIAFYRYYVAAVSMDDPDHVVVTLDAQIMVDLAHRNTRDPEALEWDYVDDGVELVLPVEQIRVTMDSDNISREALNAILKRRLEQTTCLHDVEALQTGR